MGIGVSIFLIAVGAILAFAVDFQLWWLDINVAGWVLMVVGVVGLILTMVVWSRRRPRGGAVVADRREYYHDEPGPPAV
ncbi:MAG TPA: DUF6458 family protein [Natronosporangium sp.]